MPEFEHTDEPKAALKDVVYLNEQVLKHKQAILKTTKDTITLERQLLSGSETMKEFWSDGLNIQKAALAAAKARLAEDEMLLDVAKQTLTTNEQIGLALHSVGKSLDSFNLADMMQKFRTSQYWGELLQKNVGNIGAELTLALQISKQVISTFLQMDKALTIMRYSFGLMRGQEDDLYKTARDMASQWGNLGVTFGESLAVIDSMAGHFGGIWNYSKDILPNLLLLKSQLGVSADASLSAMKNMAALGGGLIQTKSNTLLWSKALSNAAGISFESTVSQMGSLSDTALELVTRLPAGIATTIVALQKMGVSLNESAKSSRALLDFGQSVNDEMEASVLIGRGINLQKARELAYHRDIEGSTKEILRLAKQIDFANLDVFQMEAFSKATGRTTGELLDMIQIDKQLNDIRFNGSDIATKQLAIYENLRAQNQAMRNDTSKNIEQQLRERSNAEYLVAIQYQWHQALSQILEIMYPIISATLAIVPPVLQALKGFFGWTVAIKPFLLLLDQTVAGIRDFTTMTKPIQAILVGLQVMKNAFAPIIGFFSRIGTWIAGLGKLGAGLGILGRIGLFAAKWLEPIGWVVAGIQLLYSLFHRFSDIEFVKGDWIGNIGKGIEAIGGSLYDVLVDPFVKAWNWIKGIFVGSSPSLLGQGILDGIQAVGPAILKALLGPFYYAYETIKDLFGGSSIQTKIQTPQYAGVQFGDVAAPEMVGGSAAAVQSAAAPVAQSDNNLMSETTGQKIAGLLEKLLAKDTNLYLDSQLLSSTIHRQTSFRMGYGVNQVNVA
jgi:hypothetical protein